MLGFSMARWVGMGRDVGREVSREAASHTNQVNRLPKIPWCPASRPK